ncbi:hypothetical protein CCP4SC76_6900010 [Gammaproteobacteria bacterium]
MSAINNFFMTLVADSPEMAKVNAAQSLADNVKMGASAGYAFTEEAVTNLITTLKTRSDELSSEELAAVTGGILLENGSHYAFFITQMPQLTPTVQSGMGGRQCHAGP